MLKGSNTSSHHHHWFKVACCFQLRYIGRWWCKRKQDWEDWRHGWFSELAPPVCGPHPLHLYNSSHSFYVLLPWQTQPLLQPPQAYDNEYQHVPISTTKSAQKLLIFFLCTMLCNHGGLFRYSRWCFINCYCHDASWHGDFVFLDSAKTVIASRGHELVVASGHMGSSFLSTDGILFSVFVHLLYFPMLP